MVPAPNTAAERIEDDTDIRISYVLGATCWCWVLFHGTGIASRRGMAVDKYQDLQCWQLANELTLEVYALVNNSSARHDFSFRDQIFDSEKASADQGRNS